MALPTQWTEKTLGDSEGQRGLVSCSPWGGKEDKMVGWHHQLNGHEFEQTPGDSEEQESLACCIPQDCKELDTTQ